MRKIQPPFSNCVPNLVEFRMRVGPVRKPLRTKWRSSRETSSRLRANLTKKRLFSSKKLPTWSSHWRRETIRSVTRLVSGALRKPRWVRRSSNWPPNMRPMSNSWITSLKMKGRSVATSNSSWPRWLRSTNRRRLASMRLSLAWVSSWLRPRCWSKTSSQISPRSSKTVRCWWALGWRKARWSSSPKRAWLKILNLKLRRASRLKCKWLTTLKKTSPCVTSKLNSWPCS